MSNVFKNLQEKFLNFISGNFSKKYINEKNYIIYDYFNLRKKVLAYKKFKGIE